MRAALFLIVLMSAAQAAFARDDTDYELLARTGTAEEIQAAFKRNRNLKTQVFGTERETFLMMALKNDRDSRVIDACLNAESDVTYKSKSKITPIMYAARYSSSQEIMDTVIRSGTVWNIGVKSWGMGSKKSVSIKDSKDQVLLHNSSLLRKRVLLKDSDGRTAFDWALQNGRANTYEVLSRYAKDPAAGSDGTRSAKVSNITAETTFTGITQDSDDTYDEEPEEDTETDAAILSLMTESSVQAESDEEDSVPRISAAQDQGTESVQAVEIVTDDTPSEADGDGSETAEAMPPVREYRQTYLYDFMVSDDDAGEYTSPALFQVENPDMTDSSGVTLLMKAAKAGNDWDVQNLLEHGAGVNLRDRDGWSALMYAVRYQNNLQIVRTLIKYGAHVRVRNKYNATPLLLAADYSQNPEIVALLLSDRSVSEDEVFKAFIMALTSNVGPDHVRTAKIKLFLDMDIPVNRIWKGKTPLMYAAQYSSSTAVIGLLLENGARQGIKDAEGRTAFDYAKMNRSLERNDIFWSLNSGEK